MNKTDEGMSLLDHLTELRKRILYALAALLVALIPALILTQPLVNMLMTSSGSVTLQILEPADPATIYFQVALLLAFFIALPFILYQIYAFIGPGLLPAEQRLLLTTIPPSVILFALGVVFAFYVLIPTSLTFLQSIFPNIKSAYTISGFLSFIANLTFWMGILFQLPLIMNILVRVGLVDIKIFIKGWRYFIFFFAILAAVITPTGDPVNMAIVTIPFILLYGLGIALALPVARRREKKRQSELTS